MVVCIIALFVFGFLSIFSAKYRPLAKKAFTCAFSMITLRPCEVGLDRQIKSGVVSKVMKHNKKAAGIVYRNFHLFSIGFTLLFFISMAYSAYGIYNLAVFGSCDPHSPEQCIFTDEISCGGTECEDECLCDGTVPCEAPDYGACEGNCDCKEQICG